MDVSAIRSASALYAHAIAIEREAAERYADLARHMDDLGNEDVAELFRRLAVFEAEHLDTLEARTAGLTIPEIAANGYAWLDAAAPESLARELVYRLLTPRAALEIALDAERRAMKFFQDVKAGADDPALRALAQEMAMEEQGHVAMVEQVIARTPAVGVDWSTVFGEPA
jgi:rubrerythrin